jgi:hypothetical protein
MQIPTFLVLENPGEFQTLDDIAAEKFEIADRNTLPLLDKIISPFEAMLKEKKGYSNTNRPEKETTDEYRFGKINIFMTTMPTTLRTDYKTVVEEAENFFNFIGQDYLKGRLRKGVLTLDGEAYINLEEVIDKIQDLKNTALEGKEGIRQSFRYEAPDSLANEGLNGVVFTLAKDYSQATEENAANYVRARKLEHAISTKFYNPFIEELYQRTGYDCKHLPEKTVQEFVRVGNYLFPIQVIPKENPKYGKIINALIRPFEKKISKSTGELIKLKEGQTDIILARYAPKIRDGQLFIRLITLQERMTEIKAHNTETICNYKKERSIKII